MLLAIDARNLAVTIGFREEGRWLSRRRLGAVAGRSADEYALLLTSISSEARARARGAGVVEAVWMSSVAPSLARELGRAVALAFDLPCSIVGPGVRTGVRIRTEVPSEVGADLICAAAAARDLVRGPCIVVDFDAAIAFSAIGKGGDFLGAAIAPGLGTATQALRASAALLPEAPLSGRDAEEGPAIGKNTAQAMLAGMRIGYVGLVDRILRRQAEELVASGEADSEEAVEVIGTGDEEGAELLATLGRGRFVPELVLEGIAIIAARAAVPPRPVA